jgi:hypothetical protein
MSVADQLSRSGYHGLFQAGDRNAAPAIWAAGDGRGALEEIVSGDGYDDLQRLLAAEVLVEFGARGDAETLGRIYARGLALTGAGALPANAWGLLWHDDEGPLGAHLRATGEAVVPHLATLLGDDGDLVYEGSQEATLGNDFEYRVKDAAAYYIGVLTGHEVPFHEDLADRDAEIARLRTSLDG